MEDHSTVHEWLGESMRLCLCFPFPAFALLLALSSVKHNEWCVCSGAGLTEKNADGKTPLDVAQLNEQDEIATMLQDQEKEAYL